MIRRWFHSPLSLLLLATGLVAFVIQSGELGTSDTTHRLQSAHAFWTSEPPVFPGEYPEFGIHGRGGRLQSWYGIGQSLLMWPADLLGTWIAHWPIFLYLVALMTMMNLASHGTQDLYPTFLQRYHGFAAAGLPYYLCVCDGW